jgi:hypothetical protein
LERWVRSPSMPAGLVMRVRVVLTAADGAGMGALVWGWPTGRVSADSSSKRMPSQRRLRMPPRRHKTEWPYVDPNPLGAPRQSRTAVYRLPCATDPAVRRKEPRSRVCRRHRRRPAPSRPAVRTRRVDRISRCRRPVVPVAPARHRATPAPPPAEARARPGNGPALVESETTVGRMRWRPSRVDPGQPELCARRSASCSLSSGEY